MCCIHIQYTNTSVYDDNSDDVGNSVLHSMYS